MATDINAKNKSKKDAEKYIKRYKDNVEKGMSPDEAMAKAMDFDEDDEDGVDTDSVDKALKDVADLLKGNAMDKPLVPADKVDELRKGMGDDFNSRLKVLGAENLEVRKSIRELTGAHREGFDGIVKVLEEQNTVIKALTSIVCDLKKGSAMSASEDRSAIAGPAVEAAKGLQIVPTEADKAAAAAAAKPTAITAEDFIKKSMAYLEAHPDADQILRKGLSYTTTSLCSGGSLQEAMDKYGNTLGIKA